MKPDILIGGRVENNMNITRYKDPKSNNYPDTENITKNQYFILPSLAIKRLLIIILTSDLQLVNLSQDLFLSSICQLNTLTLIMKIS